MNSPSDASFRIGSIVLAALLGLQSVWLLLADLSRPELDRLPTDAQSAAAAAAGRNDATWAAWIGGIRGDLWAEAAFTFSDLLWAEPTPDRTELAGAARLRLVNTLRYAPHQSGAWLLMAGLSARFQWADARPAEALKMSYYTAPSDLNLLPLRLLVAVRSGALGDADVQQLARRDLRLLVMRQQGAVVREAYEQATPEGRSFIEQVVKDIDPTYPGLLRAGLQRKN
jgi:hypothetical protein